jgi:hypothetical protein
MLLKRLNENFYVAHGLPTRSRVVIQSSSLNSRLTPLPDVWNLGKKDLSGYATYRELSKWDLEKSLV